MHELEPPVFNTFGIPHHVAFSWLVMAILIIVAYLIPRRPALVPRGVQNAVEAVLEFVLALIDDVIGREGRRFLPLIATLGLFIFASNLLGLVGCLAGLAVTQTGVGLPGLLLSLTLVPVAVILAGLRAARAA